MKAQPNGLTCTALRQDDVDGDLVTCDVFAEWWVGEEPTCSDCVATHLREDGPTVVCPIDETGPLLLIAAAVVERLRKSWFLGVPAAAWPDCEAAILDAIRSVVQPEESPCGHPAWEVKRTGGGDPAEPYDLVEVCIACGADRDAMEDRS